MVDTKIDDQYSGFFNAFIDFSVTSPACIDTLCHNEGIDAHITDKDILPNTQFGFRPGMSTEEALFVFNSTAISAINKRQTLFAVSIDTDRAFDSVWRQGLIFKMEGLGFDSAMIRMINSFLTDRHLSVMINGTRSDWFGIKTGVPQGAVLSPSLFNIYVSDLPKSSTLDTSTIQFADDQLLLGHGCDMDKSIENLQLLLDKTAKFGHDWKLRVNPQKCQLVKIFGSKNKQSSRTRRQSKNAELRWNG